MRSEMTRKKRYSPENKISIKLLVSFHIYPWKNIGRKDRITLRWIDICVIAIVDFRFYALTDLWKLLTLISDS